MAAPLLPVPLTCSVLLPVPLTGNVFLLLPLTGRRFLVLTLVSRCGHLLNWQAVLQLEVLPAQPEAPECGAAQWSFKLVTAPSEKVSSL